MFFSGRGFFQRDFQIVPQIRAALCRRSGALSAASAEHIAEPEKVENVFDIRKALRIESETLSARAAVSETIVSRAFLRIGQNPIRFSRFFEFFFRFGVSGIFVGMMLNGERSVSAFDLDFGRCARHI